MGRVIQFPYRRANISLHAALRYELDRQEQQHQDIAKAIFVSPSALSRYINGSRPIPDDVLGELIIKLESHWLAEIRCRTCPVALAAQRLQRTGPAGCPAMPLDVA